MRIERALHVIRLGERPLAVHRQSGVDVVAGSGRDGFGGDGDDDSTGGEIALGHDDSPVEEQPARNRLAFSV